jgi:hypothetical protein
VVRKPISIKTRACIDYGNRVLARPALLPRCLFGLIVANNYVIGPIFETPMADIPPDMWDLLKLGLRGYVLGRGVEKGVAVWKSNSREFKAPGA